MQKDMDNKTDIRSILQKVQDGIMTAAEAEQYLRPFPYGQRGYEEMGFAKLDTQRELRSGFPEVIFCAGKPDEYLVSIYCKMYEQNGEVFGTRASAQQYELVRKVLAQVQYDSVSRILKIEDNAAQKAANRSERLRSARREQRIFPWRRRQRRRRNTSVHMWSVSMTWG